MTRRRRFVRQPVQQTLEKAFGRGGIPAVLHEDIEHDPVLVHHPPEIVQHAVNPDEHLVEGFCRKILPNSISGTIPWRL